MTVFNNETKIEVLSHSATQNLNLAPLDTKTNFRKNWKLSFVMFHVVGGTISQTVTISIVPVEGPSFEAVIFRQNTGPTTDFFFEPDSDLILSAGDEIRLQVTNTGTPSRTVNALIKEVAA